MPQTIWRQLSVQFFNALSDGVLRFAFCAAIKNYLFEGFWLAVENSQPINSTEIRILRCNTESKTEHTIWKNIKNWAENWYRIVCGILFDLIYSMTSSEKKGCQNQVFCACEKSGFSAFSIFGGNFQFFAALWCPYFFEFMPLAKPKC